LAKGGILVMPVGTYNGENQKMTIVNKDKNGKMTYY